MRRVWIFASAGAHSWERVMEEMGSSQHLGSNTPVVCSRRDAGWSWASPSTGPTCRLLGCGAGRSCGG